MKHKTAGDILREKFPDGFEIKVVRREVKRGTCFVTYEIIPKKSQKKSK